MGDAVPAAKRFATVDGRRMAWVEAGRADGPPIVLLHGNPTSSHLWRNVLPALAPLGRCIAPDLIGMGDSDKLPGAGPGRYRYHVHRHFLFALLAQLGIERDVTLVVHDWGSALGFDWARRNPHALRGIAYMEAIVRPIAGWHEWPEAARAVFQGMRSPSGETMVLEKNIFVERILPGATLGGIAGADMAEYRRPFAVPGEDRRPTLDWPRDIPIAGEPSDVAAIVAGYAAFLLSTPVPKLFVNAEPGSILTGAQREFCRRFPNQSEVTVPGNHFLQEDSGPAIGAAVARWIESLA
ncbi:MAG: haloalkane dehalogenase [Alphaproteobacteria bacterium]